MTQSLVSLLIPTYNRAEFLGDALDSALAQDYDNLEIIVHDDASTDSTPELLAGYSDPRLRIIRTEDNHGMLPGWNYIVGEAKGDYIKFLASDDLLEPTCVSELVAAALKHPNAALITSQRQFIDESGELVRIVGFGEKDQVVDGRDHAHWILTNLRANLIGEPTATLYPRRLVKLVGEYDPTFSQFADFEYWIRLLEHGDLVYIHKSLCSFRLHEGSSTSAAQRDGRFITEIFTLINKYYDSSHFQEVFSLSNQDRKDVTRQKTLDTLKNIKDLFSYGDIKRSRVYFARLISEVRLDRMTKMTLTHILK